MSAPSAGHTRRQTPQKTQYVSFGWTLLSVVSMYRAPGIGQTSRQSLQSSGHFCRFILSMPWKIFLTWIAPSGHLISQSRQHGHRSFFMSTWTLRFFLRFIDLLSSTGFPSFVSRLTLMRLSGQAFSHSTHSTGHLDGSTVISRTVSYTHLTLPTKRIV